MEAEFPFPSNGSAQLNSRRPEKSLPHLEFPFPSNGSAHLNFKNLRSLLEKIKEQFPFPSNGRAHLNRVNDCAERLDEEIVSIPFKRERASQLAKL